jgi:hypothetical protein
LPSIRATMTIVLVRADSCRFAINYYSLLASSDEY